MNVTCSYCQVAYDLEERLPRLFKRCGHTFCTLCIQEFTSGNQQGVICPEDGEYCPISNQKAPLSNFPKNLAIINLLEGKRVPDLPPLCPAH